MASIEPIDYYQRSQKLKPRSKCRKWRIYVYAGVRDPKTGRYKRRTKNVSGMTETEALAEAQRFQDEVRRELSSTMKFSKWCDLWMENRENDPELSPSTVNANRHRVKTIKALFPPKTRLCDIDVKACEDVIRYLKTEGSPNGKRNLKLSYIASIETGISEILQEAVRLELMPNNPMRMTRKRTKKNTATHDNTPSLEELQKLVDMLDVRDKYQIAIYLCARLGLRRGEVMGLTWDAIDFRKKTLYVRQSLKDDGKIGKPKTKASIRAIKLTDSVVEALKTRKRYQTECLEASVKARVLDEMPDMRNVLIVANEVNQVKRVQSLDSWWLRHRENYGLTCTIHELRHGVITALIGNLGISPATTAALVGHSSVTTTLNTYTHVSDAMTETAMEAAEVAFNKKDE